MITQLKIFCISLLVFFLSSSIIAFALDENTPELIWEIGVNEAPPNYTEKAFDEFDNDKPFNSKYFADTEPWSDFPKEINDGEFTRIDIHYNLTHEQANKDLRLFLDTLYATHDSELGKISDYNMRISVKPPDRNWIEIGEFKFASSPPFGDGPEERYILINSSCVGVGENIIRLEDANPKWSWHWLIWDSLKLEAIMPTPTPSPSPTPIPTPSPTPSPYPTPFPPPTPTPTPATPAPTVIEEKFRIAPTVQLRPVVDIIGEGQDGIVEIYMSNPALNDVTLTTEVWIDIPMGIDVTGEGFIVNVAAGTAHALFEVTPGTSKAIHVNIRPVESYEEKTVIIHVFGYYWPGQNKDDSHQISLTHPFKIQSKPLATQPKPLTPQPEPLTPPGFEAVFVIAGLLAVAYLLRRRK